MFKGFIKVKSTSNGSKYAVLVAISHIGAIMEVATGGSQILLKNGDFLPTMEDFEDLEVQIKRYRDDTY